MFQLWPRLPGGRTGSQDDPVAKRRIRWITQAQAEQLLALLPPRQAAMARFALATGLRQ